MSLKTFSLVLPRHAFSVRDASRAGHVWRAFQDAAVAGSSLCGWPPARYAAEGVAFVVREQTVVHEREFVFGEMIEATTWVERFRRGIFSTRQTRLRVGDELVARGTQEWVHVQVDDGVLTASRASDTLLDCFPEMQRQPVVRLPKVEQELDGEAFQYEFQTWFTEMDPLDHANHPAYVDWCEEALARRVHAFGHPPADIVPVAETVRFKAGVLGGEDVRVEGRLAGRTESGHFVFRFRILVEGSVRATATLVRRSRQGRDLS